MPLTTLHREHIREMKNKRARRRSFECDTESDNHEDAEEEEALADPPEGDREVSDSEEKGEIPDEQELDEDNEDGQREEASQCEEACQEGEEEECVEEDEEDGLELGPRH